MQQKPKGPLPRRTLSLRIQLLTFNSLNTFEFHLGFFAQKILSIICKITIYPYIYFLPLDSYLYFPNQESLRQEANLIKKIIEKTYMVVVML